MQNLKERLKTFDEDLDRVKKAAQKISNDLNGANEEPMNESNVPQQPHISRSNSFVRSGSRRSVGSSEGMRCGGGFFAGGAFGGARRLGRQRCRDV